jgi:hypothetical protein
MELTTEAWAFRRRLEDEAGRAALRQAVAAGRSPPATFDEARDDASRLAFVAGIAARRELATLAGLVPRLEGVVLFAARVAMVDSGAAIRAG